MAVLQSSFAMKPIQQYLSSSVSLSSPASLFLDTKFSQLRLTPATTANVPFKTTTIRMGGGPRTYPGGVSKWQWKRMQMKKSKQLLKARLARERQIYEMRKRAELKAAISELERPWEVVEKAPTLFSVSADEQLKVLADRFQRPGGFDMWSDKDGPELLKSETDLPSARFFPKGVVHSIKPYGKVENISDDESEDNRTLGKNKTSFEWDTVKANSLNRERNVTHSGEQNLKGMPYNNKNDKVMKNNFRKGNRRKYNPNLERLSSDKVGVRINDGNNRGRVNSANEFRRQNGRTKYNHSKSAVFDMSLQSDGSYEFQAEN
nr:putative DEAD-box ATP-dependent RNA helicase 33 [Ipomoea batatas]